VDEVKWTWTWSGRSFGYWDGNDLWTYSGKHVGRRLDTDIFGPNGWYIGELMSNGRLVRNKSKAGQTSPGFVPLNAREAQKRLADNEGQPLYPGYDDFPDPDKL